MSKKYSFLLIILFFFTNGVFAESTAQDASKAPVLETEETNFIEKSLDFLAPVPEVEEKNFFERSLDSFDETQSLISLRIYSFSDRLDSFFGDERIEQEGNGSRIRVSFQTKIDEDGKTINDVGFVTVLILPRTQEKFQLVLENLTEEDSEEEEEGTDTQDQGNVKETVKETVEESTFSAAMRYIFLDSKEWKIHADSGIHVKLPLEPFAKFRIRRSFTFEKWITRLTQTVRWSHTRGWGESTSLVFDRRLSEDMLFRFSNTASWFRNEDIFNFSHVLAIYHKLSKRSALTYFTGIKAQDRPTINLTSYNIGTTYRRQLYKDWLFLEIKPVVAFPREDDFRNTPSITFKLETLFGGI